MSPITKSVPPFGLIEKAAIDVILKLLPYPIARAAVLNLIFSTPSFLCPPLQSLDDKLKIECLPGFESLDMVRDCFMFTIYGLPSIELSVIDAYLLDAYGRLNLDDSTKMDPRQKLSSISSLTKRRRTRRQKASNSPSTFFTPTLIGRTPDSSDTNPLSEDENSSQILAVSIQASPSMSSLNESDLGADAGTPDGCMESSVSDSSSQTDNDQVENDPAEEDNQHNHLMVLLGTAIIRAYGTKQKLDSLLVPSIHLNQPLPKRRLHEVMTELDDLFDECLNVILANPPD
jgi:hypothetical protein